MDMEKFEKSIRDKAEQYRIKAQRAPQEHWVGMIMDCATFTALKELADIIKDNK